MILLEFSLYPTDKGESVSKYVAPVLDKIDQSGIPYSLTPMGTILEGDWDEIFGLIRECFMEMKKDCHRIILIAKMDYRDAPSGRLTGKVEKLEKVLNRKLKKG
jgi:uncharacterized protein (TIGR00106 family)